MKKSIIIVGFALLAGIFVKTSAQEIVYTDATVLPLYGKAVQETSGWYTRFPAAYEKESRKALWDLSLNSAGLYIRFRSDAPQINAKWVNRNFQMPHMTEVGIGGLDLYTLTTDGWRFVGAGFTWTKGTRHERKIVSNMKPQMREYMLYLPLYDSIDSLYVGVPEGYTVALPAVDRPSDNKPVVMYGTSILQGGCATRAGMAHTAIISRKLDREVINLGFSGNAHLDPEVARLMAAVKDPGVFVLDFVPNCTPALIEEKGEAFFRILREAHPDVPVVFVENPFFPHAIVDEKTDNDIKENNATLRSLYEKMKKEGQMQLYYVAKEGMTGDDGDSFVDGVHLTDLGMLRYAEHILPTLRTALGTKRTKELK